MVRVPCAALRGNLRCSTKAGSRSNSASPQTIASPDPLLPALLGPPRRVGKTNAGSDAGRHDARSASCRNQEAVMYARGCSTRGQMKSPSIAQRGEGEDRGGSGESRLLSKASRSRSVMQQPNAALPFLHRPLNQRIQRRSRRDRIRMVDHADHDVARTARAVGITGHRRHVAQRAGFHEGLSGDRGGA